MYCQNCGKNNPENAKFCSRCGQKLSPEAVEAQKQNEKSRKRLGIIICGCILALLVLMIIGGFAYVKFSGRDTEIDAESVVSEAFEASVVSEVSAEPGTHDLQDALTVYSEDELKELYGQDYTYFLYDDYNGDGQCEAFVITSTPLDADGYTDNVWINFMSGTGELTQMASGLYGYLSESVTANGHKFIVWEQNAYGPGSASFLFGVKGDGTPYSPQISGKYSGFYMESESGMLFAQISGVEDGGGRYCMNYQFDLDLDSEEFIEVSTWKSPDTAATASSSSTFDLDYIANAIIEAQDFADGWFWETVEIDRNDEITGTMYQQDWPFYAVTADGITSYDDLWNQTHRYYTKEITYELMSYHEWIERDGKLYVSQAAGLGGDDLSAMKLQIQKDSDTQYTIVVYPTYTGLGDVEPFTAHYVYEDGNWVFDHVFGWMLPDIKIEEY